MKHLKRFNEGGDYDDCHLCHGEGKEPSCPVCGKSYLDELDRKKPIDWENDEDEDEEWKAYDRIKKSDKSQDDAALTQLVKQILDAAKLDVDAIEESDPEFIPYIADMIKNWSKNK